MKPGDTMVHTDQGKVKLVRLLKTRRQGWWTVEILEGVQAGQLYDANPARLTEVPA